MSSRSGLSAALHGCSIPIQSLRKPSARKRLLKRMIILHRSSFSDTASTPPAPKQTEPQRIELDKTGSIALVICARVILERHDLF